MAVGMQCEASPKCRETPTHVASSRNVPPVRCCQEHAKRFWVQGWRVKKLEEER